MQDDSLGNKGSCDPTMARRGIDHVTEKQGKKRLGSSFDEAQRTLQYASSVSQSN